jgi:mercuric reductase
MDIQTALVRLNSQLPLKARQDRLSPGLKAAHQCVLTALVDKGRAPTVAELQIVLGDEDYTESMRRLGSDDLVVLDAKGTDPLGAYPVTLESTPHKVWVNEHVIYAMCALDAMSVAPLFDTEAIIESQCHLSKVPITIQMQGSDILAVQPTADVIVGIRWQMPTAVAAHSMCMEMVFLKDRPTAEAWQAEDKENISLFSLPEAVAFGKAFFSPLLSQEK